jgi:hypothetical protein
MTKEKPKRAYRKKTDPHESGVNHPFGEVHPFTEGQKKIVRETVQEMSERVRPNVTVSVINKKDYFNWQDIVWSVAVGIMLGIIISHLK